MIIANDGTTISCMGSNIHCSDGTVYTLMGRILTSAKGIVSQNCGSINEAIVIVVGLHGGRRL